MYITTFYSFKGGVGRTLALANVALELAQTGRRVLLVDFDLEAPGIHTFDTLKPPSPHPGVVEYVTDYLETNRAPDARGYCYEVTGLGRQDGQLWVMPAGRGDQTYRAKLARINWQTLYRERDGYLLIEDLKEQWRKLYNPHYVFIDSRTGHTDIEGICTRQLPDAVVILFFPNEQNLAGLRAVVRDIRAETGGERNKDIRLHFVMSNVPDLDDEEEILVRRMEEFETALGYDSLTATIHRYESLALLNQMIFTQARPKSRLAKEYREVKDAIIAGNIEDREGAVRYFKESLRPWGFHFNSKKEELEERFRVIREKHPTDMELPFLIGMVRKTEKRFEEAIVLLDEAVERGNRTADVFLERAGIHDELGDRSEAVANLKEALNLPTLTLPQVELIVHMLRKLDEQSLKLIPQSPAVRSLKGQQLLDVAVALQWNFTGLTVALDILTALIDTSTMSKGERGSVENRTALSLIGLSRFEDAVQFIAATKPRPEDYPIEMAFNYAVAEWGKLNEPQRGSFERVIELDKKVPEKTPGANYRQCLAVSYWAVGDTATALQRIEQAEMWMNRHKTPDFSCWRYLVTSQKAFLDDCSAIRRLIAEGNVRPLFFSSSGQDCRATS